jgi:uncharacterized protein
MTARRRKSLIKRLFFWVILLALLAGIVFVVGTWFYLFDHYIHPDRMEVDRTPADVGLEFTNVVIRTHDGYDLAGWFILPPPELRSPSMPVIVAAHGYGTNRSDILERLELFARAGYMVLAYDQRACGDSGGPKSSGGALETRDMLAAIDIALTEHTADRDRLALYGFSMGGVVAIRAAAQHSGVKAVVADGPYAGITDIMNKILSERSLPGWLFVPLFSFSYEQEFDMRPSDVDTVKAAAELKGVPLLLLAGASDHTVPLEHIQRIYEAAPRPKELKIIPDADHRDNGTREIFDTIILPFLEKYLGPPVPPMEQPEPTEEIDGEPID